MSDTESDYFTCSEENERSLGKNRSNDIWLQLIQSLLCNHNFGSHGIAPTFLKLDSWSPGAGFIPIISTKGINPIKKGKLWEKS